MDKEAPDVRVCSACGSTNMVVDYIAGEMVCQDCGVVSDEVIVDRGPEYRVFSEEDIGRTRAKPTNITRFDKGLGTAFRQGRKDSHGTVLDGETQFLHRRMQRLDLKSRTQSSVTRNLSVAMDYINACSQKLHLPASVHIEAAKLYRQALDKNLIRGREIRTVSAACVYMACRATALPSTIDKVCSCIGVNKKQMTSVYRMLLVELDLKMPIQKTKPRIAQACSKLKLFGKVEKRALELLEICHERKYLLGKDPRSMAAAIIYISAKETGDCPTQKEIADVLGVTEVTLRNRYKELVARLYPDGWSPMSPSYSYSNK